MLDLSKPIEIAQSIYWVGHKVPDDPFQCHAYLIKDGGNSVLIDPGSMIVFPYVLEKITSLISLRDIKYVVFHHQDPDIVGCYSTLERIMPEREDRRIITHWRAYMLLKHFQWKTHFYFIDKSDWKLDTGSRLLTFVFTPYAHFPGAFCTYDEKTGVLFSSDIFGAISEKFMLYAEDDEEYFQGLELFHKHYMPSKPILLHTLKKIKEKNPIIIAPQHGSIITKELIPKVMSRLERLNCGLYLLADESDLMILNEVEVILNLFFENAILTAKLVDTLDILFRELKKYVTALKELTIVGYLSDGQKLVYTANEGGTKVETVNALLSLEASIETNLEAKGEKIGKLVISGDLTEKDRKFLGIISERLKSPLVSMLKKEILESEELNRLMKKATTDPLTGLYNRRVLFQQLKHYIKEHKKRKRPFCLAMLDIDFFKSINDQHGHLKGDKVLKELAQLLKANLRQTDCIVRYGGEEFAIVMPDTTLIHAYKKMDSIRKLIEETCFCNGELRLTVSIGVAEYEEGMKLSQLIEKADEHLYEAKALGRNRVVC